MPICIAASGPRSSTASRIYGRFLLMETLMIGVFAAQDIFLFYICSKAGLIPMYLIIGIWGGKERIYASYKFLPLHAARLGADAGCDAVDGEQAGTTFSPRSLVHDFPREAQTLAMARLSRSLRGEDADVAGPHLAARRARPGTHGGLRHPRRRAAEARRLRLHPLLAADVPGSLRPALLACHGLSMVAIVYTSLVALVQKT
jgi:NADH-quinone oxidoreductase subunit M